MGGNWKTQDEPDMEMLYRLSQISRAQIRSSCTSGLNHSPVAMSLRGTNEKTEHKLLQTSKQASVEEDQNLFDVEETDRRKTLSVNRQHLRDIPANEGDCQYDVYDDQSKLKSGGTFYS
ncbi:hypothetical protein TcWFU_007821 [Taenia crassiceps]|uniref:Uncharacterized protein n=1 Tax=Taenia crassiceps TaxID=6207 RepID=A0ABR4QIP2_9CEST